MANGFQGPPAVDFYSQLSGLGDTLQANAILRQKQQVNAARQEAFSNFTALDPNSPEYGKQVMGMAQNLGSIGDQEGAFKFLTLAQTAADRARQSENDKFNHGIASANLDIARKNLANNSEGPEEVAQQRASAAASYGLKPGTAEHTQYTLTGQLPDPEKAGKPIPFDTLGGTKFLVKGPNGYTTIDPASVGQPPVPSSNKVVGDAEGVASGLYDAPKAPGQRPPMATDASQPAATDLTAIDPKTGRREDWLKGQSPDVQAYVKKVADYEIDPRTTSVKGGHRERLLSAVAQYDPTYNQNEFGSRAKAIKDFSTGPQGNIIRSFDVAIDHLDTLQKAATAMKNGNMKLLNEVRNTWRNQTGSDLPTNFQALVPLVSGEIAKAVIGSNNALSDREELRTNLKAANSPDQITGVITGYKGLMSGQLKGLRKQYEQTTGRKDFDSRLREHTLKELAGSDKAGPVTIDGYTIKEN